MKVGIITPFWLPIHGGGEQYLHRLAITLAEHGVETHVFCGTSEDPGKDNGSFPATRWEPDGNAGRYNWHSPASEKSDFVRLRKLVKRLKKPGRINNYNQPYSKSKLGQTPTWPDMDTIRNYDFMDAATAWSRALELDIALIGSPFAHVRELQARELYLQLKASGIKVGAIHLDIGSHVHRELVIEYGKNNNQWNIAADKVSETIKTIACNNNKLSVYHHINSPLFFSPDFVISCSDWSSRFIDPDGQTPKTVLHPLMDGDYWRADPGNPEKLLTHDVLMVNPQGRKNPELMADIILHSNPSWTFRILEGGWGMAFKEFPAMLKKSKAAKEHRIDYRTYIKDMREAYRKARLLFFPSFAEGYGMAAVEPMYSGTPVVSSNYPSIMEAIGQGAYTLCPYTDTRETWLQAIRDVLHEPEEWRVKGLERAVENEYRQEQEIKALTVFLEAQL